MAAVPMRKMCPCKHKGCKGFTGFVRHHPFKPGWEIRRCFTCGKDTTQDSTATIFDTTDFA